MSRTREHSHSRAKERALVHAEARVRDLEQAVEAVKELLRIVGADEDDAAIAAKLLERADAWLRLLEVRLEKAVANLGAEKRRAGE